MPDHVNLFSSLMAKGFDPASLEILVPNNAFSRIVLLQHEGNVVATPQRIGNGDTADAAAKHLAFIRLIAAEKPAPALVVTPEYSTSWDVVRTMLAEKLYPESGSIWLLGCESISIEQLQALIAERKEIFWFSEVDSLQPGTKHFLDPLLIVFRGKVVNGGRTVCVAIQFKCTEMGGDEDKLERDNLILGTKRYYIQNQGPNQSIRLQPLICSDSLAFAHTDLPNHLYIPHLYVHIQCTFDVFRGLLKAYRDRVYMTNEGERYAFITLNWARDSTIDNVAKQWSFGGSCFYQRPDKNSEPRQGDSAIDANHSCGIYLKFCQEAKSASYYFSNGEFVFDFQSTKVDQVLSVGNRDKAGIKDGVAHAWKSTDAKWEKVEIVDDCVGTLPLVQKLGSLSGLQKSPSVRERLVSFSTGNFDCSANWHLPYRFGSFSVSNGNEMPSGTLAWLRREQEGSIDQVLQQYFILETKLLTSYALHPKEFSDLKTKTISLGMSADSSGNFTSNLMEGAKSAHGAMIYLGDASDARARRFLGELQGVLKPNRAVVWYRDQGELANISSGLRDYSTAEVDPRSFVEAAR